MWEEVMHDQQGRTEEEEEEEEEEEGGMIPSSSMKDATLAEDGALIVTEWQLTYKQQDPREGLMWLTSVWIVPALLHYRPSFLTCALGELCV